MTRRPTAHRSFGRGVGGAGSGHGPAAGVV